MSSVAGLFFLKYYLRLKAIGSESRREGGKNPILVLFKEPIGVDITERLLCIVKVR